MTQRTRYIDASGALVALGGVKNDAHCLFSALVSHHDSLKSEVDFMLLFCRGHGSERMRLKLAKS